jgi:(1->4)-alpha-D-glucan 1-alpha-D-glucosylmutase
MAKGLEDTTLYAYNRLLSLNEVGGNPGEFGISLKTFHHVNQMRASDCPHSMNPRRPTYETGRRYEARIMCYPKS